jgi:hypothetical protein
MEMPELTTAGWIILGITNIPVFAFLAWLFFKDWDEFKEAVIFWFTPNVISLFRGEYWDDRWAEMKLGLWLFCCFGCLCTEILLLDRFVN